MTRQRNAPQYGRPRLADLILLWISTGKRIDGLWVGAEGDAEIVLPRVEEALGLIKTYDRPKYDRMARDLDRVWTRLLTTGVAQFSPPLRACLLDERFVAAETTDAALIAAVIVHEATHARLWRCGFGYEESERQRIESICVRRELAFARRFPDGRRLQEFAEGALAMSPSYWTDSESDERHVAGSVEALKHLGWGRAVPTILAIRKWRSKRAAVDHLGTPPSSDEDKLR